MQDTETKKTYDVTKKHFRLLINQECFFICGNSKLGENEFIPADVMDENLLAARNAYRMAHGMPSSSNKEL